MSALALTNANQMTAPGGSVARLSRVMRSAGWEIEFIDLDLTGDQPKVDIKIHGANGRWLLARVDSLGRATMETFHRERALGMTPNTRGCRPLSPQVIDTFLGRQKFVGARQMLRVMTNYLTDNSVHPVALSDMRSAWALAMSAPTTVAISHAA